MRKSVVVTILCTLICPEILPISMVYNFRIAQITREPLFIENQFNKKLNILALLFDVYQQKYDGKQQNFAGGLGSFIVGFKKSYYLRTDFAASHIHEWVTKTTTFSGSNTDDVLITAGKNFDLNTKTSATLSGLFGIPTHRAEILEHVDFGYGQYSIGTQLDSAYKLTHASALLAGLRYIYFIPRTVHDCAGNNFCYTIGQVGDVLGAYKYNWQQHGIELGYAFRADFGATIHPHLDDIVKKTNYLRNNFYCVYKYRFSTKAINSRLLFNIAYGFDQKPKDFGNKHIITLWTSWRMSF